MYNRCEHGLLRRTAHRFIHQAFDDERFFWLPHDECPEIEIRGPFTNDGAALRDRYLNLVGHPYIRRLHGSISAVIGLRHLYTSESAHFFWEDETQMLSNSYETLNAAHMALNEYGQWLSQPPPYNVPRLHREQLSEVKTPDVVVFPERRIKLS